MIYALGLALIAAGRAAGLGWGYRGQRDQEREQVVYLRDQLRIARGGDANVKQLNPPATNQSMGGQ